MMPALVDEQLAWIALAASSLSPVWWKRAIAVHGSARALFECTEGELARLELTPAGVANLRECAQWSAHESVRTDCRRRGISIAHYSSEDYPELLREIPDPPAVLYFRGPPPASARPAVAVVGTRRPTRYGRRVAHRLAAELAAAGATVISGLAYGIDACAHQGALTAGKSAAVLACGLDHPYPRGNRHLFDALVSSGGVASEYPPGTGALPFRFPARNRIVTGSARALIIVEAAERSGSLVSARLAADQGRELFAVPGNIDSPVSRGTNALLREGCRPLLDVQDVADVLASVGVADAAATAGRAPYVGDPDAERVLSVLESEPAHFDDLVDACRLDGTRVLELLTTLELAGLAERSAGGLFALAKGAVFTRERPRPQRTA